MMSGNPVCYNSSDSSLDDIQATKNGAFDCVPLCISLVNSTTLVNNTTLVNGTATVNSTTDCVEQKDAMLYLIDMDQLEKEMTEDEVPDSGSPLSAGAIVGMTFGALAGATGIAVIVFMVVSKRKSKSAVKEVISELSFPRTSK